MRTRVLHATAAVIFGVATLAACGTDSEDKATSSESSTTADPGASTDADADNDADKDADSDADGGEDGDGGSDGSALVCPEDAAAVDVPVEVSTIPLPDGAVVYNVETRDGTGTILTAATPQPMSDVLATMNAAYSADGYQITDGETEEHDAEANWTNAGVRGRWAIRDLSGDCDSGTQVQVLVGVGSSG